MPARVTVVEVATGRRRPVAELAPPDCAGVSSIAPVVLGADGRSWAYSYRRLLGDLYLVSGLQ